MGAIVCCVEAQSRLQPVKRAYEPRVGAFFNFPRTGTTVVTVGRTASGDTGLGGAVSFFGFFTILLLC